MNAITDHQLAQRLQAEFAYWSTPVQLLVCRGCQICVWLDRVREHLSSPGQHTYYNVKLATSAQAIAELIWPDARRRDEHATAQLLETIQTKPDACQYLPVLTNGLLCNICKYVAIEKASMMQHRSQKHRGVKATTNSYYTANIPCQQLFAKGKFSGYLAVNYSAVPDPEADPPQSSTTLLSKLQIQLEESDEIWRTTDNMITLSTYTQASPFVKRAKLEEIFQGKERSMLCGLVTLPTEAEKHDEDSMSGILFKAIRGMVRDLSSATANAALAIRFALNENDCTGVAHEPFSPPLKEETLDDYARVWFRIVRFFVNVRENSESTVLYSLTSTQADAFVSLIKEITHKRNATETTALTSPILPSESLGHQSCRIQMACLTFCQSLLCQTICTRDEECSIIIAICLQGVRHTGWVSPGQFAKVLSAVISIGNMMFLQQSVQTASQSVKASQAFPEVLGTLKNLKTQYGQRGTASPFEWALNLRAYAMAVHYSQGNSGEVFWDGDQLLFRQCRINVMDFRGMIQRRTFKFIQYFYKELCLQSTSETLGVIPWNTIIDAYWSDDANTCLAELLKLLGWNPNAFFQYICETDSLRCRFFDDHNNPLRRKLELWLEQFHDCMEELLALTHLTYGQPSRGTELLSALYRTNGKGHPRSIIIARAQLCFVLRHSKNGNEQPPIYRFVPRCIGEIILHLVFHILPWVRAIQQVLYPGFVPTAELWPAQGYIPGRGFDTARFSAAIERVYSEELNISNVTLSTHRHLSKAFVRRCVPQALIDAVDSDETKGMSDGPPNQVLHTIIQGLSHLFNAQAGHSDAVANSFYAVPINRLVQANGHPTIDGFYCSSFAWILWLGFIHDIMNPKCDQSRFNQQARAEQLRRLGRLNKVVLEDELKAMYGATSVFKGIQHEVLDAIVSQKRYVTAIMPTGGGKSLLFMLPAHTGLGGSSIVIVPLRMLQSDLGFRCQQQRISYAIWTKENPQWPANTSLLFITPESVLTNEFATMMNQQLWNHAIDRIFIDEAHECLHSFRHAFQRLSRIVDFSIQVICMSGTLMPSEITPLWTSLGLPIDFVITLRDRCNHVHIRYVHDLNSTGIVNKQQQATCIHAKIKTFHDRYGADEQALVFVTSAELAKHTAEKYGYTAFYSALPDKEQVLDTFRGGDIKVLVTTNVIGNGVDLPYVRYSLHIGCPETLAYYKQESGRTARRLLWGICELVSGSTMDRHEMDKHMRDYTLETKCFRRVLSRFDEDEVDQCQPHEQPCSLCVDDAEWRPPAMENHSVGSSSNGGYSKDFAATTIDSTPLPPTPGLVPTGAFTDNAHGETKYQSTHVNPRKRRFSTFIPNSTATSSHISLDPSTPLSRISVDRDSLHKLQRTTAVSQMLTKDALQCSLSESETVTPSRLHTLGEAITSTSPSRSTAQLSVHSSPPDALQHASARAREISNAASAVVRGRRELSESRFEHLKELLRCIEDLCLICGQNHAAPIQPSTPREGPLMIQHPTRFCTHPDAECIKRITLALRGKLIIKELSSCSICLAPPALCRRWSYERGWWNQNKEVSCSYFHLIDVFVAMWFYLGTTDEAELPQTILQLESNWPLLERVGGYLGRPKEGTRTKYVLSNLVCIVERYLLQLERRFPDTWHWQYGPLGQGLSGLQESLDARSLTSSVTEV